MYALSEVKLAPAAKWGKRGTHNEEALRTLYSRFDGEPIDVSFRELTGPLAADDGTHSLYPYPARLIRHIPRFFLHSEVVANADSEIIDPFCGSGTVLVEAQNSGRQSFGIDSNPVAALISQAKTTPIAPSEFYTHALEILRQAKKSRRGNYPPDFVVKWYTVPAISALARLSAAVEDKRDSSSFDLLRVVFALTCREVSRKDPRIPVPVISQRNGDVASSDVWKTFERHALLAASKVGRLPPDAAKATVSGGDARIASAWSRGTKRAPSSVIITSPPYGAAQKYVRSTSLEAGWLGFSGASGTAKLERDSIGREHLSKKERAFDLGLLPSQNISEILSRVRTRNPLRADIYANYFMDMKASFMRAAAMTTKLERIVMIAGTNIVTGEHLETHKHLAEMVEELGFTTRLILRDEIRGRTLMTTRRSGAQPASAEYVYIFEGKAADFSDKSSKRGTFSRD